MMKVWKKVFESDLDYLISEFLETIKRPAVIILSGPVGAGKTTFIRKFLKLDSAPSPTYSLINEYHNAVHADFYRIEDAEEITHLELSLYSENKDYIFIEWGKKYLSHISNHFDPYFSFYELEIDFVDKDDLNSSRNFNLKKLSV